jgi:hypothetical protein
MPHTEQSPTQSAQAKWQPNAAMVAWLVIGGSSLLVSCTTKEPSTVVAPNRSPTTVPTLSVAPSYAAKPPASSHPGPPTADVQAFGCDLQATITPDQPTWAVGQPVYLTFKLTSNCDRKLAVLDGGDYQNKYGRAESYKITAKDAQGQALHVLDSGRPMGGYVSAWPLSRDKPFQKRLLIIHWIDFQTPGTYTLTVKKVLQVGDQMTSRSEGKKELPVLVSTSIEVKASTPELTKSVIDVLGKQMFEADKDKAYEAEQALKMMHDERIVPLFAKLLTSNDSVMSMEALWGLRTYSNDQALSALQKALTIKELRLAAAQTLAKNKHPKAWDTIWALHSDPDKYIRLAVLHALAKRNQPTTKARLQAFTNDKSPMISNEAKRYLQERKNNP